MEVFYERKKQELLQKLHNFPKQSENNELQLKLKIIQSELDILQLKLECNGYEEELMNAAAENNFEKQMF